MEVSRVPNRYLRTPEAGRHLGLSGRTLEKHRTPRYRKIGGRVPGSTPPEITIADPTLTIRNAAYPVSIAERR